MLVCQRAPYVDYKNGESVWILASERQFVVIQGCPVGSWKNKIPEKVKQFQIPFRIHETQPHEKHRSVYSMVCWEFPHQNLDHPWNFEVFQDDMIGSWLSRHQGHVGSQNANVTEMTVDPLLKLKGPASTVKSHFFIAKSAFSNRVPSACFTANDLFSTVVRKKVSSIHAMFPPSKPAILRSAPIHDRRTFPALPAGRSHPSGRSRRKGPGWLR